MELQKYLKKFSDKYKTKINDDRFYIILCKQGEIDIHSLAKKNLCYYHFGSKRKFTTILNHIKKNFPSIKFDFLEGIESFLIFPESILDQLSSVLEIKRRRQYTPKVLYMIQKRMLENKKKGL